MKILIYCIIDRISSFWLIPMGVDLVVCIGQNLVICFVVGSGKYHAVLFYMTI